MYVCQVGPLDRLGTAACSSLNASNRPGVVLYGDVTLAVYHWAVREALPCPRSWQGRARRTRVSLFRVIRSHG